MGIPHRILIVDDNATNLLSFKTILSILPVVADTVLSGSDALNLAKSHTYSLVLLDIQMPDMDGFETLTHLRALPGHEFTPIILISAVYTEDQDKLKGIQTGAVDFIPKPVNPDLLRAKVQVFLDLEENRFKLNSVIEELEIRNRLLSEEIAKGIQIADELEIARAKAEKASEYKSRLLVNMSHEIRTPVNSILGFADLIINPSVSSADKEKYLGYVSRSSQNLLFLIDEILEHSRLEAGEVKIVLRPTNIANLCHELLDFFENSKLPEGKEKIPFELEMDPNIHFHHLFTDGQRLRQILSNLISNAFKYTSSGRISFGFQHTGNEVEFFVKDTGIGVSPEDITEIFNRFKRAESRPDSLANGTGLGLSISKNLVELLGGKIWVTSESGVGSEFRFSLPVVDPNIPASTTISPEPADFKNDIDWSKETILIAEDEELNFLMLQESLRASGVKILWAKTGPESINLVSEHPEIKLVLMDIRLPGLDGYQATRLIKSLRPDLPIIIQTALALSDERNESKNSGGDDYITKPINRRMLIEKMSIYLTP